MWVLNIGQPVKVAKLNEEQAIEQGAQILGEVVIFSIAAVCLIADYIRSSRKEAAKEAAHLARLSVMENGIQELGLLSEKQEAQIRELTRAVLAMKPPKNIKIADYVPSEVKLDFKRIDDTASSYSSALMDNQKQQPTNDGKQKPVNSKSKE